VDAGPPYRLFEGGMDVPFRKRFRRAVRSVVLVALLRAVSLIPLGPALRMGGWGGAVGYHLFGKTRRLALLHLGIAFPEKSEAERQAIALQMFVNLGRAAMEITAIRSYDHRLESYVGLKNGELLQEMNARGKGIVFVTGHLGNWELIARRVARAGVPNSAIAKRGDDFRLMGLIEEWRLTGQVTTLWREDASTGRAIIKLLKGGGGLGLLVDQNTDIQGVFVPFFGRLAHSARAPADLALRFGSPILVGTGHRRGPDAGDGLELEFTEIPHDANAPDREAEVVRVTAACQAVLEDAIRRYPSDWVWMHKRWKTRPEADQPKPATGCGT
jgi:KDO2-lipid IV(A) lauroyltransferase